MQTKPIVLIIMDGFGMSPIEEGNAVLKAKTPTFDQLIKTYPSTLLHASGQEVGLEFGEIGNSEVGHLNIGTGRVVMQDLPRINESIKSKSFFTNQELLSACELVKKNKSKLHLLGLTSTGGVHSHLDHLLALLDLVAEQGVKDVYLHLISDGRDTAPKKILDYIKTIEAKINETKVGKIATICGRFYAMDRDNHWEDRTKLAYDLLTAGKGDVVEDAKSAIELGYKTGQSDENLTPKLIDKNGLISKDDAIIFYNFRTDRVKQLTSAIIDQDFDHFKREKSLNSIFFVSFTNYGHETSGNIKIAFFSQELKYPLAEILSKNNLTQLHIAETEKYAHVTYFFNGGIEKPYPKEDRILVPSPRVLSYDKKPEMSANEITTKFINYFKSKKPDFTVINFANPDMVGHTGNLPAVITAVEDVDACLSKILKSIGSESDFLITADHGNAEQKIDPKTKEIDKEHTTNPVPFILMTDKKVESSNDKLSMSTAQPIGVLADVAPTILDLMNIKKPSEMTGQSLKDLF